MAKDQESRSQWLALVYLFLGLIIIAFISLSIYREVNKNRQVQDEIEKLKEEAAKIEKENSQLSDKLSYLDSKDYQEKEARDKLNLQNPGEKVVVIKPGIIPDLQKNEEEKPNENQKVYIISSNVQKWWNYFFK